MRKELSPGMQKVLEDIKVEMRLAFLSEIPGELKIVRKATKKKELKAYAPLTGGNFFQLFVNDKFYGTYFWKQETKRWRSVLEN